MRAAPVLSSSAAEQIDPPFHAALARASGSLSFVSMQLAWLDWALHLAVSPGKRLDLFRLALTQAEQLTRYARGCMAAGPQQPCLCVLPPAHDRRFTADEWRLWPFNVLHQSFLLTEQWWDAATHGVWGVAKHHEDVVAFAARQWLDMLSPGNQLATNPVVLRQTFEQRGGNLARGALNALDDVERAMSGAAAAGTEGYVVGENVAVTPGKVVLRNRLIELIQYAPATPKVQAEPILIVPAWIMKYYILDLSAQNSLIRYLVEQGHTVFCISWKNPDEADRDLDMDDYLQLGVFDALAAVNAIVPGRCVHATGYCLGGTLLAIAAAAMARDGDSRLASMTLFAAQTDFCEPGELGLFIDEAQVSLLEAQMAQTGYLRASQMAGAFQMLRSYDLLWSRIVGEYLLGDRAPMNDLMAWNADATRMPARMHGQYLRHLFLNDDLSEGRYPVGGKPVLLSDIDLPTFVVGTLTDHVAPWRSVYKLHHLTDAELTFVLTSGGHNAGIVSPPANSHRRFQMQTRAAGGTSMGQDDWLASAPMHDGSWWPAWHAWLLAHASTTAPVKPPKMGAPGLPPLGDAPGTYVLEK
ncbi:PHA/PHB synthase family protein [Ralstonia sp. R-29]|uniref:PHA/PHB synthase family protein n=1 Tax=Ralstonia sp. R-29 TaxID=3404059 RepID=UPI003CE7E284